MDIYQIIITYYPIWSLFEWIIFLSVLALAVCIAVVLYKKQKITTRQSIAGILLLLYLLLVFGSTVFTRMPGERQYQLEVFWSWKKILHYIEQHGMVTGTGLLRENLLNIVMLFPAGMLLPFVFGNRGKIRWWHGLLFGIFISGCIEGLQLILCRGLFEFDDMIHNSLGCMAGCAIGAGCLKKFNKK